MVQLVHQAHEDDPGPPKRWKAPLHLEGAASEAPDSYLANTKADPDWEWTRAPEIREALKPQVAELARVATFLASAGVAL